MSQYIHMHHAVLFCKQPLNEPAEKKVKIKENVFCDTASLQNNYKWFPKKGCFHNCMETNYQFRHTYDLYNYIMNILASKEKKMIRRIFYGTFSAFKWQCIIQTILMDKRCINISHITQILNISNCKEENSHFH